MKSAPHPIRGKSRRRLPLEETTRRQFLGRMTAATGLLAAPWAALPAAEAPAKPGPTDQEKVEAAIPARAFAPPRKPRKLLIFDLNVNYGGHGSIRTANLAFTLMGRKTGAFDTVVSRDPAVFQPESLKQFDAVFFNNTVGNMFQDPGLRQSLVRFVYSGGGLMGVHGTSVGFTQWPGAAEDWPEFGLMIGGRGANHKASDERVFIKLDDAAHPINRPFDGQGFEYRDEFFRVHEPYSRKRLRVLLSIDTEKTDLSQGPSYGGLVRPDNDYALAWVRRYGRGRTFYCTIAHNPRVFWDPKMLQFYLAAAQFVLGDLPAPTTPSGRLTPPLLAQEQLGWRLGLDFQSSPEDSLFEAIDKAAGLGLLHVEASDRQAVGRGIGMFGPGLSEQGQRELRLKLDAAGVALPVCHIRRLPETADAWRPLFEFSRGMGIETLVAGPPPQMLDTLEKLCDEHEINLALQDPIPSAGRHYAQPADLLKVCAGRSVRVGAWGGFGSWMMSGVVPLEAIRALKDRLFVVQVHDLSDLGRATRPVPWGTGAGKLRECLEEIHRLGLKPTLFGIDSCQTVGPDAMPDLNANLRFFNRTTLELAKLNAPK